MNSKILALGLISTVCIAGGITYYYFFVLLADDNHPDKENDDNPNPNVNIIDHNCARLGILVEIPDEWISKAKSDLHIIYWHTSHGSQLTDGGMSNMRYFIGGGPSGKYAYGDAPSDNNILDLEEISDDLSEDIGDWVNVTRDFLDDPNNEDINVVMWSWCSMAGHPVTPEDHPTNNYLTWMETLISEYPNIQFVFMTAHAEGDGHEGYVGIRNELIREHCINNNRILYDFADIESYMPGNDTDFWAWNMYDNCNYDDGVGHPGNWAEQWQAAHSSTHMTGTLDSAHTYENGGEWYECDPVHAEQADVMGNLKAYGAWYLFSVLSGWEGN